MSGIRCQPLTLSYTFCHGVEGLAQFDGGFQGINVMDLRDTFSVS